MPRVANPKIAPFLELNVEEKKRGKRISAFLPGPRYDLIRKQFPSVDRVNWAEAFKDVDLFGRIIKDILAKAGNGPGPRPVENDEMSRERLRQLLGEDFAYVPFREAFGYLAKKRSLRSLANKTGLSKHVVHDLKLGRKEPDLYIIEEIARAFSKHPSYFMEYRVAYILEALGEHMSTSPETTVGLFKKLKKR